MTEDPTPGTRWLHRNGTPYTVLHIANEPDDERYPRSVVYQGPNGKVWVRRADDWYRSMALSDTDDEHEVFAISYLYGLRWNPLLGLLGPQKWHGIHNYVPANSARSSYRPGEQHREFTFWLGQDGLKEEDQ